METVDNFIKNKIKEQAVSLGFLEMKVAKYEILSNEMQNYSKWIGSGYNATMKWMEKNIDKRKNIRNVLENAQSVLVFSHSYYTAINHNGNNYKISRYAWGDDYHIILMEKLKKIENYLISLFPKCKTKSYVDTGPILEKQWAVRSGLGWQGKNSLILNKDYGSYFFIGIIITDLIFQNDEVVEDKCGTCTKCINACPTNAIIGDRVIDSNKCISYWTIEAKHDLAIPLEIRNNMNGWAFGCDICQEICPWNKNKPKLTTEKSFFPRYETNFNPEELKKMSTEEFNFKYKNSPIKRTKLKGILRNLDIKE